MARKPGITNEIIFEKYEDGSTVAELASFSGISDRAVRNILYKNGIKNIKRSRKYAVNEDFFTEWNEDVAYVLGLIMSDGRVTKNDTHTSIQILQADKEYLQGIIDLMESQHPIKRDANSTAYRVFINSKKMVEDIYNLVSEPNKKTKTEFPIMPTEYMKDYIRGVFDGDARINNNAYNPNIKLSSISYNFLKEIFTILRDYVNLDPVIGTTTFTGLYVLSINSVDEIQRLSKWLYTDANYYSKSKKELLTI